MNRILPALLGLTLIIGAGSADAAQSCRDAKGKFIKCPAPAAAPKQTCRDAKGHFAKCGAPGAKPVAAKSK